LAKVVPVAGMLLSGKVGSTVFCVRANGTGYSRAWVKPHDQRSTKQIDRRVRLDQAVQAWRALDDKQKDAYRARARFMRRTGYHLFLSEHLAGAEGSQTIAPIQNTLPADT
jgi:hypothetical protein